MAQKGGKMQQNHVYSKKRRQYFHSGCYSCSCFTHGAWKTLCWGLTPPSCGTAEQALTWAWHHGPPGQFASKVHTKEKHRQERNTARSEVLGYLLLHLRKAFWKLCPASWTCCTNKSVHSLGCFGMQCSGKAFDKTLREAMVEETWSSAVFWMCQGWRAWEDSGLSKACLWPGSKTLPGGQHCPNACKELQQGLLVCFTLSVINYD